jgi:hypothetical protein
MRFFLLALFVVSAVLLAPRIAVAEPTKSIELHADVVDYYSNRFILTADGNVRAQLSDGTIVSGNTFSMDLKLNRYLIAGNVHIDGPHIHQTGAAFAGYPDLDRNYFLNEGDTPDRWTYYDQDFSDSHPGREQPGDAFYFPDLAGQRPYIISNSATIFLKNNVEFPIGSRISVLGLYTPTPGFVINYSSNSNFYQNAFTGATFDIGIPFHGAADALSAMHIRYDYYRGLYTAFDQHFVHNLDYAVFSIDPVTQNERQTNVVLYKRLSPATEVRIFGQLSSLSNGIYEPTQAADYFNGVVNTKLGKYAIGLNVDQFNNDLLADAPPSDQFNIYGNRGAGHPFDATLTVQSYEDEIRAFRYVGVPVKFQYRLGHGYQYDGYGLTTLEGPTFGGALYPLISENFVGLTVYTSPIKLAKSLTVSAKSDRLEEWYSLPHHTVTTDTSVTLARTPSTVRLPAFVLSYNILNVGDFYGAAQRDAYPAYQDTIVNQYGTFTGNAAFDGLATSRTLTGSMIYAPTPYFALNLTQQHINNTPRSVPGFGVPTDSFTADVRVRINRQILVDVGRTYYFNFGGQLWSPQFAVQFSP